MTIPRLAKLDDVVLKGRNLTLYNEAVRHCGGSRPWQSFKCVECRQLLSLAQLASCMTVLKLSIDSTFRAMISLEVPVPLTPDAQGRHRVVRGATLVLEYPEEALRLPLAGTGFVVIRTPRGVFHPNVSSEDMGIREGLGIQILCLGTKLAARTPVKEIVLQSWAALNGQSVQVDPRDHAGVLNDKAAAYWMTHIDELPLSTEPFLDLDTGNVEE